MEMCWVNWPNLLDPGEDRALQTIVSVARFPESDIVGELECLGDDGHFVGVRARAVDVECGKLHIACHLVRCEIGWICFVMRTSSWWYCLLALCSKLPIILVADPQGGFTPGPDGDAVLAKRSGRQRSTQL